MAVIQRKCRGLGSVLCVCGILILVQREETRYLMPAKPVDYETGSSYNPTEPFYGVKCKILDHIQKLLKVEEYFDHFSHRFCTGFVVPSVC